MIKRRDFKAYKKLIITNLQSNILSPILLFAQSNSLLFITNKFADQTAQNPKLNAPHCIKIQKTKQSRLRQKNTFKTTKSEKKILKKSVFNLAFHNIYINFSLLALQKYSQ